jgi:lipoprotein-releasing system permease protein
VIWTLFKHYVLSNRSSALIRTIAWLCIGGVGIGVTAMTVVISVMNGFDLAIKDRLLAVEPHVVVSLPPHATPDQEESLVNLLKGRGQAHVFESRDVVIRTMDGLYGGGIAKGVDGPVLTRILREVSKTKREQQRTEDDLGFGAERATSDLEAGEVTIGVDLAYSLGILEGDDLVLVSPDGLLLPQGEVPSYEKVRVKSLLRTNVPDIDSQYLYYTRSTGLPRLNGTIDRGVEIRLKDSNDHKELVAEISAMGFEAETWEQRNSALFHSLRMEKMAIALFLSLSILIASFSIITVLVLLVTHKKSDIGLLMAMGMEPSRARNIFAGVGLWLSGIGLFGGLGLGLGICYVLDRFTLFKLPDVYYDTRIPVEIDTLMLALTVGGSLIIALLASWVPAIMATKMSPTEAIRAIPSERT